MSGDRNPLDRAEEFARRILNRLGAGADKLSSADRTHWSRRIEALISELEKAIETSLKEEAGIKNIAPNRFKVLFTYEETSRLGPKYMEVMGKELSAATYEYIHNRRYQTLGPISVEVTSDVFARNLTVKASFDSGLALAAGESTGPDEGSARQSTQRVNIRFRDSAGGILFATLDPGGDPAYAGRASGAQIHIEDSSVSRMHCSLALRSDGTVVVADLQSANGTHVNEQRLQANEARALNVGDRLRLGDVELIVAEISSE
jgi:FHA domain-containing protein